MNTPKEVKVLKDAGKFSKGDVFEWNSEKGYYQTKYSGALDVLQTFPPQVFWIAQKDGILDSTSEDKLPTTEKQLSDFRDIELLDELGRRLSSEFSQMGV